MDSLCLEHCLTESEKQQFEDNGYFVVEDAVPQEIVEKLTIAFDRIGAEHLSKDELPPDASFNILDFVGRDEVFIEMLDWHTTFPKVWGILGWNIKLYHSHMIALPPLATLKNVISPDDSDGIKTVDDSILNWKVTRARVYP